MASRSVQRNEAYQQLRALLLNGSLVPGARLGEVEWSTRLSVHRSALREAYALLTHEGLLEAGKRGGYFVPILERADLDEVLELRLALELGALRRLARLGEPVCCDALRSLCITMRQMVELDMPLGMVEADRRFHQLLVELAGNQRMIRAYHQAPLLIFVSKGVTSVARRANAAATVCEHERICDLLEARRFADAGEALQQHLCSHAATLAASHRTRMVD